MSPARLAWLCLAAAVLLSALAVVQVRHESRQQFVALQALGAERDRLNVDWGRLQLEQGAWATHGRVERLAREKLDMRMLRQDDVVIIRQPRQ
ncbi:cell division protein FtsL [Alkalilimnicola sp. S0819]|uniref:cell division protein FtsL n=1 Tax=Alkalilimnicola sp. S0819 TaxID=2613922 RepID=UPI0012624135|nr:cell division protein FtsL [Alkalilimnicola sp. S0819]KAB7623850.1 cell division protein FtsL [Alkalilimnicola sp. S0819]MPQ16726.1 cell division protein FtsL [Alkalilimnicola sp. S0819]